MGEYYQINAPEFLFPLRGARGGCRAARIRRHGRRQAAGLRILLAGVIAGEKMGQVSGKLEFGAVGKNVPSAAGSEPPLVHEQAQIGMKRDRAKRQHGARPQDGEFLFEIAGAIAQFLGQRTIIGRRATRSRRDVGIAKLEAVIGVD